MRRWTGKGDVVRDLNPVREPGLHRVSWDLTRAARPASDSSPARPAGPVPEGDYRLVLNVDGQSFSQILRIQRDPNAPPAVSVGAGEAIDEEDAMGKPEVEGRTWIDD